MTVGVLKYIINIQKVHLLEVVIYIMIYLVYTVNIMVLDAGFFLKACSHSDSH
jgi:hypothetical protein